MNFGALRNDLLCIETTQRISGILSKELLITCFLGEWLVEMSFGAFTNV